MKKDFILAVNKHNLPKVRITLVNSLNSNPTGVEFKEMLTFAQEHLDDLFEDNREAYYDVPPKEKWDTTFMDKVADDLEMNFSVEKLAFYQAVIEEVRKDDIETILTGQQNRAPRYDFGPNNTTVNYKKAGLAVTTGGAVLSIVGICKGITLLTLLGGAVLIGGVLICLKSSNRK